MLKQILAKGELVLDFESISSIRGRVAKELQEVAKSEPALVWG